MHTATERDRRERIGELKEYVNSIREPICHVTHDGVTTAVSAYLTSTIESSTISHTLQLRILEDRTFCLSQSQNLLTKAMETEIVHVIKTTL